MNWVHLGVELPIIFCDGLKLIVNVRAGQDLSAVSGILESLCRIEDVLKSD